MQQRRHIWSWVSSLWTHRGCHKHFLCGLFERGTCRRILWITNHMFMQEKNIRFLVKIISVFLKHSAVAEHSQAVQSNVSHITLPGLCSFSNVIIHNNHKKNCVPLLADLCVKDILTIFSFFFITHTN